jgi:hypothetical protein
MKTRLAADLSSEAEALGYGTHGRQALLEVVLEIIREVPSLFRKR